MRVVGQVHALDVPLPDGQLDAVVAAMPRLFSERYVAAYGVAPASRLQIRALRVRVVRRTERSTAPAVEPHDHLPEPVTSRPAYFTEHRGFVPTPVFDWVELAPGDRIQGAAIVQAPDTTVVVPPGTSGRGRPCPQPGAARVTAEPFATDVEFVSERRAEIVAIAGDLFAERGYANTTVREIADAAGILSGSLYHHFDSKESMIEALLRDFLDRIGREYASVTARDRDPVTTLRALVHIAFGALETDRAAVSVMLNEYNVLVQYPRFAFLRDAVESTERLWVDVLDAGMRAGDLRQDVPADAVYRFLRDAIWVSVRWYRPDGPQRPDDIADDYLTVLLGGLAMRRPTRRIR